MTSDLAFIRSIIMSPDDDLPRLMYADFLEENGEAARAEFIRVQVELARWNFDPGFMHAHGQNHEQLHRFMKCECNGCQLRRREREIEKDNPHLWIPIQFRQFGSPRRGWLDSITLSWQDFLRHERDLIWSPAATDECPKCSGTGSSSLPKMYATELRCRECEIDDPKRGLVGTGRIHRPMPATAQPIRGCRITSYDQIPTVDSGVLDGQQEWTITLRGTGRESYTFSRVKCPTCDGTGDVEQAATDTRMQGVFYRSCPTCHGTPLNSWTCPEWPSVVFEMPVS